MACLNGFILTQQGHPKSRSGNKYLYLAVLCATSNFLVAMAAPNLPAADFTTFFMHQIVAQHGVPATVVHDSGPEFGEPWGTCLQELGVEQRRSSTYHPNTNGQAENMVKQIMHALQRMLNENGSPETWDERLTMALLGLRTAPNAHFYKAQPSVCGLWETPVSTSTTKEVIDQLISKHQQGTSSSK
jgi:transposase InsO family protein